MTSLEAEPFKIDFEKAFDKIEHPFIFEIMRHKGFSDKWIGWVQTILNSTSSSVLLMASLGKVSSAKKGRQGDPL